MGYHTSNAAYAYDMQPDSMDWASASAAPLEVQAPGASERPNFDVLSGGARESDLETSPAFRHCIKLFCLLAALFVAVGMGRVALAGVTTGVLNANAALVSDLEAAQDESADLEVMYSVYGSSTRIRDLAESYGMVASEETVTIDLSDAEADTETEAETEADGAADESATADESDADAADASDQDAASQQ